MILAISTYHQDLGAIALAGKYIVADNHWFDFYNLSATDQSHTIFNYQPLAYLLPSLIYIPFASLVRQTGELLINNSWVLSLGLSFVPLLLIYKLPMILADIAILFYLPRFFSDKKNQQLAQIFWSLNPIAIYVSSIMGQVDILMALFLLLSYYYFKKQNYTLASIFIGISALIKPVGLILLPIVALSSFWVSVSGFVVYVLGILPYIHLVGYRYYALFADQISKSTYAGITIAPGTVIPFFFMFYLVGLYLYFYKKITPLTAFVVSLLSSLVFTHFHPQWFVWLTPLLILKISSNRRYYLLPIIFASWLLVLLSFDDSLLFQAFLNSNLTIEFLRANSLFVMLTQLGRASLVVFSLSLLHEDNKS